MSDEFGPTADLPPASSTGADVAGEAPAWRRLAIAVAAALGLVGVGTGLGYNLGRNGQPADRAGRAPGMAPGMMAPIERLTAQRTPRDVLPDLVDNACPAVVRIDVPGPAHGRPGPARMPAVGVMVTADGAVLASLSALGMTGSGAKATGPAPPVTVHLGDGRAVSAIPIATDPLAGVALLRVDASHQDNIRLSEGDFSRIGAFAFALAMQSGDGCMVQPGVISSDFAAEGATGALYARFGGLPARWSPGAPVFGADGGLIGLMTFDPPIATPAGKGTKAARHATPAPRDGGRLLPSAILAQFVTQALHDRQTPSRVAGLLALDLDDVLAGRLGVDSGQGAAIVAVDPASPAGRAGILPGDVIATAAGRPIANAAELGRALAGGAGPIALSAIRAGTRRDLTVTR